MLMDSVWTEEEIRDLSERFHIAPECKLHEDAEDYHFPRKRFLDCGYAPPGGYVKDFGVVVREGRLHLFHIDGRPGEVCWITGNEISFGHASTSDFCRWIRHPMPLAVGTRSWESEHVWAPFVYKRDGLYCMFYMGSGCGETFISYATSSDLETWERWESGPIQCAVGRDPFVWSHDGRNMLLYTGHGGARVAACVSDDMVEWEPIPDLISIPGGAAAESSSLHPLDDGFVLWFNDYGPDLSRFRAAYAISENPLQFSADAIRAFRFETDTPGATPSPEVRVSAPVPLSIELIARGERTWFVCYFRWHIDRGRLFFGELDWSCEPATIREINTQAHLNSILAKTDWDRT